MSELRKFIQEEAKKARIEALKSCTYEQICDLLDNQEKQINELQRQLAEATSIVAGMDIYIEAECHESWANNYEIRESAFVDMAKKLKQLKEKGE